MADGKKAALIWQGLLSGGVYGAATAGVLTSTAGDNFALPSTPAPSVAAIVSGQPPATPITSITIGGVPAIYLLVGLLVIGLVTK